MDAEDMDMVITITVTEDITVQVLLILITEENTKNTKENTTKPNTAVVQEAVVTDTEEPKIIIINMSMFTNSKDIMGIIISQITNLDLLIDFKYIFKRNFI